MKRFIVAALLAIAASAAYAQLNVQCANCSGSSATMPAEFTGDWCFAEHQSGYTRFQLPSWVLPDSPCIKILSVQPSEFFGEDHHCEPMSVVQTRDIAPSGITYIAKVVARCHHDGPVGTGKVSTFEFDRYKGNLTVINK